MNVGKFICKELRSHFSNFYFRLSVPWHVSFSDLHYGMCELKIPLRTLLEHPDFELFRTFCRNGHKSSTSDSNYFGSGIPDLGWVPEIRKNPRAAPPASDRFGGVPHNVRSGQKSTKNCWFFTHAGGDSSIKSRKIHRKLKIMNSGKFGCSWSAGGSAGLSNPLPRCIQNECRERYL